MAEKPETNYYNSSLSNSTSSLQSLELNETASVVADEFSYDYEDLEPVATAHELAEYEQQRRRRSNNDMKRFDGETELRSWCVEYLIYAMI